MVENDPYDDLPDDPEQAFLKLEAHFRGGCERAVYEAGENERTDVYYVSYIARVLAAIQELGLQTAFQRSVPSIKDVDYHTYLDFSKDVEHYTTMLKIRNSRRSKGLSVRFDAATKSAIRHLLEQIKQVVDSAELDDRKREALYARIRDLEHEVNRDRTSFGVFGALVIEACGIVGEAANKMKPAISMIERIGKAFSQAKSQEEASAALPPPAKRIEPPKSDEVSPPELGRAAAKKRGCADDLDADIPF